MSKLTFFYVLLFALIACLHASSSSSFISYDVLKSHSLTGRRLFQQSTGPKFYICYRVVVTLNQNYNQMINADCPVDFEHQNYTIITSQCKGPQYNKTACCTAFKRFACPFSTQLNDLQSVCSDTMFSYINLYGKYPPALFSSMCVEGSNGLDCADTLKTLAQEKSQQSSSSLSTTRPSMVFLVMTGFLISWFGFFF